MNTRCKTEATVFQSKKKLPLNTSKTRELITDESSVYANQELKLNPLQTPRIFHPLNSCHQLRYKTV